MKRTWQKEKTHIHTLCDEYTAAPEDLTKLNFPLLPFPIFHLPQHRRTCRGKNNAHCTHATLYFLICAVNLPCFALLFCQSLICNISLFIILFSILLFSNSKIKAYLKGCLAFPFIIYMEQCGWPTSRERQVQEFWPNLLSSLPKLYGTVPITLWPTKAFPGLALVMRAPPPLLLWLQGVSLDACFTATPRTCPPAASTPREAQLQRSNNFAVPDGWQMGELLG